MRIKVVVTQAHIDQGVPQDCNRCPIALALIDAGFTSPWVDETAWRPDEELSRTRALPRTVSRFIHDFDQYASYAAALPGDPVLPRPFTFVVNVAEGHIPPRYFGD